MQWVVFASSSGAGEVLVAVPGLVAGAFDHELGSAGAVQGASEVVVVLLWAFAAGVVGVEVGLDTEYPSWDEKLNRVLQSWRDSAAHQARRPMFADDRPCEDCRRNPYVIIAQLEDDSTAHWWPHWMQHTLWEHLIDVRGELSETLVFRPYAEATIAAFLDGAGLRPRHTWDEATRQAVQIVTDQAVLVDLWLRYRMATLTPWPRRVRRSALHERGRS